MPSAILAAVITQLEFIAAALDPEPATRSWSDQTAAAVYPAYLVHVPPLVPEGENTALNAVLWRGMINIASTTHGEQTPPSSGSTPKAADPDASHCRAMHAAAQESLLAGFPSVDGLTLLDARIGDAAVASEGRVNLLTFRVDFTAQLAEV